MELTEPLCPPELTLPLDPPRPPLADRPGAWCGSDRAAERPTSCGMEVSPAAVVSPDVPLVQDVPGTAYAATGALSDAPANTASGIRTRVCHRMN
ncbi:hypothetical protein [Streptomyces oceani]|uniref:hypothetical protein n=1 Tax=Streptomyces oceani TaxID=1075402 RepID=UPI001112EF09|nr:hypothetical protein [Streptomyces oceani]